jgi:hypothetical protein
MDRNITNALLKGKARMGMQMSHKSEFQMTEKTEITMQGK